MAEVKFSGIGVVDMNGSVGNTTFARNEFGAYAKNRLGAPAGSAYLSAWQDEVANVASVWEFGLTDAERREWYKQQRFSTDSMAVKNVITGFDLFMSINLTAFQSGAAPLILPPEWSELPTITAGNVTLIASVLRIRVFCNLVGLSALIYCSAQLPAGRMSTNQIYFFIANIDMDGTYRDITGNYTSRFGAFISGAKVFFKAVPVSYPYLQRGIPQYQSIIF